MLSSFCDPLATYDDRCSPIVDSKGIIPCPMGLSNPLCEETIFDAYSELATGEGRILVADGVAQDLVNNGECCDKVSHDAIEVLKESAGNEDQAQLCVMRNT